MEGTEESDFRFVQGQLLDDLSHVVERWKEQLERLELLQDVAHLLMRVHEVAKASIFHVVDKRKNGHDDWKHAALDHMDLLWYGKLTKTSKKQSIAGTLQQRLCYLIN